MSNPVAEHSASNERVEEAPLFDFLNPLLRARRVLLGLPFAGGVLSVALWLLLPPTYTASTTFVPEAGAQSRLPQGLSGIAGQLGITLAQGPAESPRFYGQVLRSRQIMERVLQTRYRIPGGAPNPADSASLLQLLDISGRNLADSIERGIKQLNSQLSVSVDNQTNIVTVSIQARDRLLAATVANSFVQYLNDFNAQTRQSQARERRKFVEQRVAQAGLELRSVEDSVRTFYERNRGWQESARLVFEEAGLRRQVTIGQEVYLTLKRDYENARIEEVNDTPVITVIDIAAPPQRQSSPRLRLLLPLALAIATILACIWAYAGDYMGRALSERGDAYGEFVTLRRQVREEVQRGFGIFGRKRGTRE
jgi:uncharacterized protein involved in exopolysaccharide biosynthesis